MSADSRQSRLRSSLRRLSEAAPEQISDAVLTIPNGITILRLLFTPSIILLIIYDSLTAAFWLFVAAALSDALDGFIAKRFNLQSRLGSYLDPAADKVLAVGLYLTLAAYGALPIWLVFIVISRDVLLVGGTLLTWVITDETRTVVPLMISRLTTVAQFTLLGGVLFLFALDLSFFSESILGVIESLVEVLVFLVAGLTFLSGAAYAVQWLVEMSHWEREVGEKAKKE